jgi:hypothetical protein
MIEFEATIKKFEKQGEKTGWTYIEIPAAIAEELKKGNKRSFRVKGRLDGHSIKGISLLPMGGGSFIMAINAEMRKAIGKRKGAMVKVKLGEDKAAFIINQDLQDCINDEPKAKEYWDKLPPSHQKYYSKWVDSAKGEATKVKRITQAVEGMRRGLNYGEMMRFNKN